MTPKPFLFSCALACLMCFGAQVGHAATALLFEDFEDSTLTYTSNPADSLGDIFNGDYYGRLAPDTVSPPLEINYGNVQGSGFYAVQDSDSARGGGGPTRGINRIELNWTGIDVSAFTFLRLSWYVAEDVASDARGDWDENSSFQIAVQRDGLGYEDVFRVEANLDDGNQTDSRSAIDTDGDGIGDGDLITANFTQYVALIEASSLVDIRIRFEDLDAGDEDFALDNVRLVGSTAPLPVPLPAGLLLSLSGLALLGGMARRRRSAG